MNADDLLERGRLAIAAYESKSPHQLAVDLVEMQRKHGIAMAALHKMQDQRDQLVTQLADATRQCGVMADLLREARRSVSYQMGMQRSDTGHRETFSELLNLIDAAVSGEIPAVAQEGVK